MSFLNSIAAPEFLANAADGFSRSAGILIALTFVVSIIETFLPFRKRAGGVGRLTANLTLMALFFLLNFLLTALTLGAVLAFERNGWGLLPRFGLPLWAATIFGLAILDLSAYAAHLLMHKFPPMWRVHRVHHSDAHIDATTAFRQHPIEGLWRFVFTIGPALLFGLPLAAVAFYRALSGANAIFEHMNTRLPRLIDKTLSFIVVTPDFHKVHHSSLQRETDSNYGNLFSIYDRLFNTLTPTDRAETCQYGLENISGDLYAGELLALPFLKPHGED